MADLIGAGAVQGGAVTVVMTIVVLILRGHLVPRSVLRDLQAVADARIAELAAERDMWRSAHQVSEEARHMDQSQAREMLELSRTANHVLMSLPKPEEVASAPRGKKVAT